MYSNNYLFTGITQNRLVHDILNHSYINGVFRPSIRKEKYFILNFNTDYYYYTKCTTNVDMLNVCVRIDILQQ